jgi:hypothetical protein
MHATPAVRLGCTDCHGGDAASVAPQPGLQPSDDVKAVMKLAHPHCRRCPASWHDSSANPERTYTLLNKESPEFIRFVNPSDYRVAREACGSCHLRGDRGDRAVDDVDRRDAVGRRGV